MLLLALSPHLYAQQAGSLIDEGNSLYEGKDFTGAAEKYRAALKLDSASVTARYKLAFSLNAAGREKEALSELQRVVRAATTPAILSTSYSLMASLFDKMGFAAEAIKSYRGAIKIDSADHLLHYGLGIAYFRNRQYAEAELSAIASLKLDPRHAASMRLYGLVTFHQNKRAPALLALCTFLWMDPRGPQAAEAYTNIKSILKGGVLKHDPGTKTLPEIKAETAALNRMISTATAEVAKRNYPVKSKLLAEQLKAIFGRVGKLAQEQNSDDFFSNRLASFYYQMSQTAHVPAFASFISQHSDSSARAWMAAHKEEVERLKAWAEGVK